MVGPKLLKVMAPKSPGDSADGGKRTEKRRERGERREDEGRRKERKMRG